jgi:peroxiredoxin
MKSPVKLIAALASVAIGASAAVLALHHPALALHQSAAPEAMFTSPAGEAFVTSELRGKVAVVHFWATWCPECVSEMPRMIEAHRKFAPRGYETVAVAVRDQPSRVAEFARSRAVPFKIALDADGEISKAFGNIRVTPTTFVIDRQGRVLKRYVGEPDWKEFERLVAKALEES